MAELRGSAGRAPTSAELRLASDFGQLFHGCPGCGWAVARRPCPGCGESPELPADLAEPHPLVGLVVRAGRLPTARRGVVVAVHSGELTILRADGSPTRVPEARSRVLQTPPGRDRVRSPAGALVAATAAAGLTPAVSQQLHHRAHAEAAAAPGGWRALAVDCAVLGNTGALSTLSVTETERCWWTALAMWRSGDLAVAVTQLLNLPAGRYPGRLALWWRAFAHGALPEHLHPAVAAAARQFAPDPPAVAVAAALLLRRLGERTGAAGDAALTAGVRALGEDRAEPWLAGDGGSPAARLLGALAGAVPAEDLAADPALPAAAPPEVLDDLADRGAVPGAWLGSAQTGAYLRARTAIETLDDAELVALGYHDERARRRIRSGEPLPADLPAETVGRFSALAAARAGDESALLTHAGAAGLDPEQLRVALSDPTSLPAGPLVADQSLAQWLLDRSTADPTGWSLEGLDPPQRGFAARLALRRARGQLYRWDWPAALADARTCLRFAADEKQRDEAHNLIAAAQWQLGNDQAASQALAVALDGEYTAALQVNFAVVASELEPRQAAAHLARLVRDAPDLPLRTSAALQAVRLWSSDRQWRRGEPLPVELATAVRELVVEPLDPEAFRNLVRMLATHDHEWLSAPDALAGSPHRSTVAARIWTANARGPDTFVKELGAALRQSPESWVTELRDQLVQDLADELRTGAEGSRHYGLLLLEHQFPVPLQLRVVVLALAVPEVCAAIDVQTAEPAGKFLDWLDQTVAEVTRLPDPERGRFLELLGPPVAALSDTYLRARRHQHAQALQLYQSIQAQIAAVPYGMTVNPEAVRAASKPGVDLCRDTTALLQRLIRLLDAVGLHQPGTMPSAGIHGLSMQVSRLQEQFTILPTAPPPTATFGAPLNWPRP